MRKKKEKKRKKRRKEKKKEIGLMFIFLMGQELVLVGFWKWVLVYFSLGFLLG